MRKIEGKSTDNPKLIKKELKNGTYSLYLEYYWGYSKSYDDENDTEIIRKDRRKKEDSIMNLGSRVNSDYGIWVTTQIVEASLDIDFDYLFTELSDLSGLFQRMGRCYRNRSIDLEYNCYVFTGGDKKCSGVGPIIDEEIFHLSKETINKIDGIINETTKVKLISSCGLYFILSSASSPRTTPLQSPLLHIEISVMAMRGL